MPKHRVKLHNQKVAVSKAYDLLAEYYPTLIKDGKIKREAALAHMDYLLAAMETIDGLDERKDMREAL